MGGFGSHVWEDGQKHIPLGGIQSDSFMHFLAVSCNGQLANRRLEWASFSSSDSSPP